MSNMYQEYSASSNNARPCYSNLKCYGAGGRFRTIVPPTPVSVQPWIFNVMTPHAMPQSGLKPGKKCTNGCLPYRNLDGTCRRCWTK